MLGKTLENPLDGKEIQAVNSKEIILFIGRTDAEAETPILWSPDVKMRRTDSFGKTPDARND